ncbi:YozQ family protein [Siminovitchia sp. FSL H7-0308]|uniref:DUF4025 domain-containing protein n=1 Tax=Siminovitchia thermophila TaxID=1245522 RepID=A0ABS2RAF0_9BACI|nr:YozQ family protein [Siminovitchia thermophila]MBM7716627.1 hypothetical protein [Siminovitchia thermophila]
MSDSLKLSGRQYKKEDEHGKDILSKGLAITHEQVSDVYTEGVIEGVIENENGENIALADIQQQDRRKKHD